MFIEQLKNKNFQAILYLPIPLCFLGLIVVNYIMSQGVDVNELMHKTIEQFGSNLTFFLSVVPLSVGCLVIWFWVKFVHCQSITSLTTSRKSIDWSRIFFSFGLWTFVSLVLTGIGYYFAPENFVMNFNLVPFLIFFFMAIILLPLQTSFEEYLFRGYILQGLGIITNSRLIAFLTTSILFGLMHWANPEVEKLGPIMMVYYIGTGFLLGIMTLMDEGLELALGFHAANNLIGALLVTSDWGALQTNSVLKDISVPSGGFEIAMPVILIYPIIIFIFSKKYGWKNWSQKLFGKLNSESFIN